MQGRLKTIQCKHIPEELVMRLAADHDWPLDETIPRELGFEVPYKVIRQKVQRLEDRGKLDSGVSWRCAWPRPQERTDA
jgi:hypothetical protein